MHDIWNPWHGCKKCSEGCENCYMYFLDGIRGGDASVVYRTRNFAYPLQKRRGGGYKIAGGELIRVCMTSDFFVEEADEWRGEAWEIMRERSDVRFYLLTKRPQRVKAVLPDWWGEGLENVIFNVTCENQRRADERIPLLHSLPFRHKGIMCAPLIGAVSIKKYLAEGQIEQVICGGENYEGARPCDYAWVKSLHDECKEANVTFCFIETGNVFIKDGRIYRIPSKRVQSEQAARSNLSFEGKKINWRLTNRLGVELDESELYVPQYRRLCLTCGSKPICNGCSSCGKCGDENPLI